MFKLFSRSKSGETKNVALEKEVKTVEQLEQPNFEEETVKKEQEDIKTDFNEVLSDLKEAITIKKELGSSSISPEEVFQITGLSPEQVFSYLEGEHFAINISNRDLVEEIEASLKNLEKEETKEGGIRKFANNKIVKAAFVSLILLAKMTPAAQAATEKEGEKDEGKDKVEASAPKLNDDKEEGTYYASSEDFRGEYARRAMDAKPLEIDIRESNNHVHLEMANYFDTDSDYIPKEAEEKIKADFEKFLSHITPENAQEVVNSEFKLYGSSDERKTSNWEGSNEELTKARLESVETMLGSFLKSYPFENLPADLREELRAKTFEKEMPVSESGPEAGVTYITDLMNPETGSNYTESEVNQLKTENPSEYKKLLDDCRKISFEIENKKIDSEEEIPDIPPVVEEKIPSTPPALEKLNSYENVSLLFDNSPSVGNSYNYMADIIANQEINDVNLNFGTFSDRLDKLEDFDNSSDIVEAIHNIKFEGNSEEMALSAVKSALEKMPANQKNAVFAMTDEAFQDVSWENLQELKEMSTAKNAEVYFYYADDTEQVVRQISLEELEEALKKDLIETVSSRIDRIEKTMENRISLYERQHESHSERLVKFSERNLSSDGMKIYEALKLKVSELGNDIEKEKQALNELQLAWQEGEIDKIFKNEILQEKLKSAKRMSAENLGTVITSLAK